MGMEIKKIDFDRRKRPGIDFDLFPLEEILSRADLDHDPRNPHRVEFYLMLICTEGSGSHTIDFKEYNYQEGSILTIRKDQIHQFHTSDTKGSLILFTEEFAVSYLENEAINTIRQLFNELLYDQCTQLRRQQFTSIFPLIEEIKKEFTHTSDNHTSGIIRNLLQVLISRLHRLKQQKIPTPLEHKYVPQFLQFQSLVEQHCMANKSVQFYADQLHITTRTLNNLTHQIIHQNAKAFIDETLLLQIKRMLINSDLTIKEIAYQSGFSEPTNFFKFFKRFSAQTPEEFRSLHKT